MDEKGGVGHADMGYNYVVGADGYSHLPNAFIPNFAPSLVKGPTVFHSSSSNIPRVNHVSHQNAERDADASSRLATWRRPCAASRRPGQGACCFCSAGLNGSSWWRRS